MALTAGRTLAAGFVVLLLVLPCRADDARYVTTKEGTKAALYDRPSVSAKQVGTALDGCKLTVKKSLMVSGAEWLYVSWERTPKGTVGASDVKISAAYIRASATDPAVSP
jgi:hypothetical protein